MGMWDKDREYGSRLDEMFPVGSTGSSESFILWGATIDPETVETANGAARRTRLQVAPVGAPTEKVEATTLASAIADKVERARPDDFPVVACLRHVKSSFGGTALVVQLVRDYTPSKATREQAGANIPKPAPPEHVDDEEEIPF